MQSGLKRKKFDVGPCPPGVSSRFNTRTGSKKQTEYRSVTGLATDALNRLVIASTLDGTINVGGLLWFYLELADVPPPVLRFLYHTTGGNIGFAVRRNVYSTASRQWSVGSDLR